jgi:hypothetical protein
MHLLGATVPQGLDGEILVDALEEGVDAAPITYDKVEVEVQHQDVYVFSDDEQRVIKDRLRGLGYL